MTYSIVIDQEFAVVNDLSLVQVSTLASFLTLPTWTKSIAIDGDVWYQYSDEKMVRDFPLLFGSSKRCYKNLKVLEDLGFVCLTKLGREHYIKFTSKCQNWGKEKVQKGTESPKTDEKKSKNGLNKSPKTDSNYYINNIYTNNIRTNIDADGVFYDSPENDKNVFNPLNIAVYDGEEEKNCAKKEERKGRKTSETKCLFADSRYFNYEDFEACFKDKEEFSQVDIYYYYSAVADWSASKGKKQNDWIATARNFMRKDKEQNKLHIKLQEPQEDEMYKSLLEVMQRRQELDEKVRKYTY